MSGSGTSRQDFGDLSFERYLEAKIPVDDRSLNRSVIDLFRVQAERSCEGRRAKVLDLGCGTGAMFQRLSDWGLLDRFDLEGLELDPKNVSLAQERLGRLHPQNPSRVLQGDFLNEVRGAENGCCGRVGSLDGLISCAFLDLFDLDRVLPVVLSWLKPGGWLYLPIHFDGVTRFLPEMDPDLDRQIESLYHLSMDERLDDEGLKSGDSKSGSRLLVELPKLGAQILAAGSSDWIVTPGAGLSEAGVGPEVGPEGYRGDEAYFLYHLLSFVEGSLTGHPKLSVEDLSAWLEVRRAQLRDGKLIYMAHQLDLLAVKG